MPRNWQYPRWRRAALQVALLVVLAAMTGAAAYVSHRRSVALRAELGPPVRVGRLLVPVPEGWLVNVEANRIEMADPAPLPGQGSSDQPRRILTVIQAHQPDRALGPGQSLQRYLGLGNLSMEPFPFLGRRGVLAEAPRYRGELDPRLPAPGLYALSVQPDGLAVVLALHGDGAFGPTARRFLRQFADALALASTTGAGDGVVQTRGPAHSTAGG